MNKPNIFSCAWAILLGSLALVSCNDDPDPAFETPGMTPMVSFTALGEGNQLYFFENGNLNAPAGMQGITGLPNGEMIISIDYRPATGQLYGLGSSSRLYLLNENNGTATALGMAAFTPAIEGGMASLDFNPTVDRIRLVSESGQNLRLHPETGAVVATDGRINGGMNPRIAAVAYTNSVAGATSTTLYDIDIAQDKLYKQNPPNDGGLEEVGNLGVDLDGTVDFDINPDNSQALAVARNSNESRLYSIDLNSGRASWVGVFTQPIISISFKTNPVAYAADASGKLYRFNPMMPQPTMVDFQGLAMGEVIVGLDFRPANGQLVAVSNQSQLYAVNTSNGMLTKIGNPLSPSLAGGVVGFDFNPTVDRIRLVTDSGQNLRLHPDLGTVVATDGNLNPGMPKVSGAAYTGNFPGTTATTLFVIDHETNMLYTQTPPNDGVLVSVGALGIDVTADNGFDIGGKSDMAFAVLRVANATGVYRINLMTGAATKVSDLTFTPTAMAVGLGF
ncbi:uncharacterized protein DUF4394 [Algoriphagus aquaeductus]|uniref:Uncharacterized protein DUF4394 n=1 Tax=Algoriphagus aquaeductus TaxID=475299 RepID=A0A326RW78_9BACT|nr:MULTISPECIES: DUF4394 domain-containing protein [Algoriphagus]PZV81622.1 uncharacterized protein DUF4394 [Algoriphagus aquaeductus]